jgi:hypothetical protein
MKLALKKIVWWLMLPFWWPMLVIAIIDWAADQDIDEETP